VLIETLWSSLTESWQFIDDVRTQSNLDEETFKKVFNFLGKWGFIEVRGLPRLSARRRPGTISPLLTVQLLRSVTDQSAPEPKADGVIAQRIYCRNCGSEKLRFVDGNKVECSRCSERQWYAIGRSGFKRLGETPYEPVRGP